MKLQTLTTAALLLTACTAESATSPSVEPSFGFKADGVANVPESVPITFGDIASDTFSSDFQFHAYEFSANAGASVSVEMNQPEESALLDTRLYLFQMQGSGEPILLAQDEDSGYERLSNLNNILIPETGLYTVVVAADPSMGRGDFNISISCVGDACYEELALCPNYIQYEILDCMGSRSETEGQSLAPHDLAQVCGTAEELQWQFEAFCQSEVADETCDVDPGVVGFCQDHLAAEFPEVTDVSGSLNLVASPDMDSVVSAIQQGFACVTEETAPGESECHVAGRVYEVSDSGTLTAVNRMGHLRQEAIAGMGSYLDQSLALSLESSFADQLLLTGADASFAELLIALGVTASDAEFVRVGTWNELDYLGDTCVGGATSLLFRDAGLLIELDYLTCDE